MKLNREINGRLREQFAHTFGLDNRPLLAACPLCFSGNLYGTMSCPVNKAPETHGRWTEDILCIDCNKYQAKGTILLITFDDDCPCDDKGRLVSCDGEYYVHCPCHGKNHFLQ